VLIMKDVLTMCNTAAMAKPSVLVSIVYSKDTVV